MRFLFASDSFKGTLSSAQAHRILSAAALKVFPSAQCQSLEVGDGGEGTTVALAKVLAGSWRSASVHDPLGRPHTAHYFMTDQGVAILEMAQASGFTLLKESERNPLKTNTYGTGELILAAINAGAKSICLGIGGSATNDGGTGLLSALGVRFFDPSGNLLSPNGEALATIGCIDIASLSQKVRSIPFTVMCDVTNPLLGPNGATAVYGPQKGATPAMILELEKGMTNFFIHTKSIPGLKSTSDFEGAGAAGGLGYALKSYLNADIQSGVSAVLSLLNFEELARHADYIVTGEGRLDCQSSQGKLVHGILKYASKLHVPVIALVGDREKTLPDAFLRQFYRIYALTDTASKNDAMTNTETHYQRTAERLFNHLNRSLK